MNRKQGCEGIAKLTALAAVGIGIAVYTTGCSGIGATQMFSDAEAGHFLMYGDAEGVRAYNEGLVGLVTDAKASPDVKSGYWQHKDEREKTRRFRFQLPFMKKQPEQGGR